MKEGGEVFCWSDANSTWIKTSFIRVSSENANIVRLQAQRSVAAQHVYTKVEPHEAAAASGAHKAAAAFGAMHVDQELEVEDETLFAKSFRITRLFRGSRG